MGFIVGPRLNAAGRVGEPMEGLRLLLTDDPQEAAAIAARLEVLNTERQALDQRMLDEALAQVDEQGGVQASGLVLAGDAWHPGVVGIVASRVVERFGRPTFLVAFDGETGRASGRSISRFDLHARAGAVRRPARAVRRPPHGGGAHHPAGPPGGVPRAVQCGGRWHS